MRVHRCGLRNVSKAHRNPLDHKRAVDDRRFSDNEHKIGRRIRICLRPGFVCLRGLIFD